MAIDAREVAIIFKYAQVWKRSNVKHSAVSLGGHMKNIQVIDGAENCTFSLFQTEDHEFEILFPTGQDIEFADDFFLRVGEAMASSVLNGIWKRPIEKPLANGIHGTLFYQQTFRKKYYPTKKESEMISNPDKLN